MKLVSIITCGVMASLAGSTWAIDLLDRPSPPPCCVDGVCYAHATQFGYFQTRWRVWPGLSVAPMPTVQPPTARPVPGMPIIEPPKPEEEDRQAPPPIKSAVPQSELQPPAGAVPRSTPLESLDGRGGTSEAPPAPRTQGPGGFPQQPSGFPQQPGGIPQPFLPPGPSTTPLPTGGERSGADVDRPPLPPFASARGNGLRTIQSSGFTSNPRAELRPAAPSARQRQRAASDPPPAPPLALGQAAL
jgi:hypothetical protein